MLFFCWYYCPPILNIDYLWTKHLFTLDERWCPEMNVITCFRQSLHACRSPFRAVTHSLDPSLCSILWSLRSSFFSFFFVVSFYSWFQIIKCIFSDRIVDVVEFINLFTWHLDLNREWCVCIHCVYGYVCVCVCNTWFDYF